MCVCVFYMTTHPGLCKVLNLAALPGSLALWYHPSPKTWTLWVAKGATGAIQRMSGESPGGVPAPLRGLCFSQAHAQPHGIGLPQVSPLPSQSPGCDGRSAESAPPGFRQEAGNTGWDVQPGKGGHFLVSEISPSRRSAPLPGGSPCILTLKRGHGGTSLL